jgi:carbamoylphosphate synthase large subunit
MMRPVMTRTSPFVVKFPQSLASHGVYVIQTPEEQKDVVETITPQVAAMIQQLNTSNEYLHPCALITQDLCPGTPVALSLFVTPTDRAIFTGCTTQIFDANGIFGGGFMDYRLQNTFQTRYTPLMETLGKFLQLNGYHGPIAVDVMNSPSGTDQIIDLNPRASASYPLGFLKTHFSLQGNLHNAALLYLIALKITRDQFERIFAREYQSGQIVICGWCHGKGGPGGIYTYSMVSVALGGKTKEELELLVERVGKYQVQK